MNFYSQNIKITAMNIEHFRQDIRSVLNAGMTQKELEALSSVPQPVISDFVNRKKKDMKLSTALKLLPYIYPSKKKLENAFNCETTV